MKLNFICGGANTSGPLLISLAEAGAASGLGTKSEKLPAMQQIPDIVNTDKSDADHIWGAVDDMKRGIKYTFKVTNC